MRRGISLVCFFLFPQWQEEAEAEVEEEDVAAAEAEGAPGDNAPKMTGVEMSREVFFVQVLSVFNKCNCGTQLSVDYYQV